jgi:hypothetical protein
VVAALASSALLINYTRGPSYRPLYFADDAIEIFRRQRIPSPTGKRDALIMLSSNFNYSNFLQNWAVAAALVGVTKFVVVAEDGSQAFLERYYSGHVVAAPGRAAHVGESQFGDSNYKAMVSKRPGYLRHALELGYDVLYVDVDIVFLQNPLFYSGFQNDYCSMWAQSECIRDGDQLSSAACTGRYFCTRLKQVLFLNFNEVCTQA